MNSLTSVKIVGKRVVAKPKKVYDITVQGNHNLFVRDKIENVPILAHNCSVDVQASFAIHHLQHKWASCMPHTNGSSYLETFHNYVLHVIGNCTSHTISVMEQRGIQLSRKEFKHLLSKDSKLKAKINEIEEEFYKLPNVKKANRMLLNEMGAPSAGLFGDLEDWVFNIRKEAHIQLLFLTTLKIKDYTTGKSGKASVGKAFQAAHKATHKEVELYGEYKKYNAILSTYIKGWSEKMDANPDSVKDYRIRPGYSFLLATGRSNSFGPNLQNVAEHHVSAYFVKYTMQAPLGYLKMDADYSSHEVRCIHLDMYVDTDKGKIQLGTLIDMPNPPKVKSYCHTTETVEYQPIGTTSKHTTEQDMLEIEYEGGSIYVTENHPVWSVTRNCYIKAIEIVEGEEVAVDV